ncbi:DUF1636 family protein [Methylovirgula sp. 4M-Z18]|uniref:DUF1636 family protein n=1 Tax=Methylovirgula sp. 4M-Z18 TaxID=2293567 RepID=UPI000E2EDD70|nr:DUF1636 domain-containing protein [Methylovirgula sp. 4M-Z18]RFB76395.1 DUF1636 domain-containing protein [Methylovirgula sp. 4M-Z18]
MSLTAEISPSVATIAPTSGATLYFCVTCKGTFNADERPGAALYEAVLAKWPEQARDAVEIKTVECLSVCKRPATLALAAPGKWTYVIGDLDPAVHADDIVDGALKFAASPDGVIPWRERPQCFRKGVISRVPPLAPV